MAQRNVCVLLQVTGTRRWLRNLGLPVKLCRGGRSIVKRQSLTNRLLVLKIHAETLSTLQVTGT